ncbi:MAG TPA: response regulator transcription factor [Candidatus Baltobacteraceae bacterium]|jgi:NarL family two-component system response regulator LiaR|nr:response regulator transcription factor [Candidatus Baltobacteraceae bacterium]
MIRVVLVDDHPIVLDGIALNLEDAGGVTVVGRASNAHDALAIVREARPDVVVLDLELPGRGGVDVLRDLKGASPSLRIVVFTAYGGRERIAGVLESGADSYVLKGTSSEELVTAIHAAAKGEHYLPNAVASELIGALREPGRERLTQRERQIVRLLALGRSNKEIGDELRITERTVKYHVSEILARLGASNRAHAVTIARELGLD